MLHRNLISLLLSATAALLIMAACKHAHEPDIPPPADTTRTILVYMQANNSLGSAHQGQGFDDKDIDEILLAAKNPGFGKSRVIIYHQPAWDGGAARLYEATPDGLDLLKEYDAGESSVSEARMSRVIADTKRHAPANAYGIVLWSHASGWWNDGIDQPRPNSLPATLSFGIDSPRDDMSQTMSINSLARVLDGQGFEFVYFDCCFMASVEVAYQLRDATKIIIGSAAELPSPGTPYDRTLPLLTASEIDYAEVGRSVFGHYDAAYIPREASIPHRDRPIDSYGCTFTVMRTDHLESLAQNIRDIYAAGAVFRPDSPAGNRQIQQFAPRSAPGNYCDMADYIDRLGIPAHQKSEVMNLLDRTIIFQGATPGIDMNNTFDIARHCGLTIYVPQLADPARQHNYRQLDWYGHTATPGL